MDILKKYRRCIKFRNRKIANRNILMGMRETFEINELGNFIWQQLDSNTTLGEIIASISEEYDSDKEIIEKDVLKYIKFLYENEIIEEVK